MSVKEGEEDHPSLDQEEHDRLYGLDQDDINIFTQFREKYE